MTFEIYYNISKRSANASITPCIGRLFYDLLPYSKSYCHIIQNLLEFFTEPIADFTLILYNQ